MILRALSCIFIFLSAAANAANECEARLADLYYGGFVRGLKSGALADVDLEIASISAQPVNPLARMTATAKNSAAKRLLESLVHNPEVSSRWPETRAHLANLLHSRRGDVNVSGRARDATRLVLAPVQIAEFADVQATASLSELESGETAIATVGIDGTKAIVSRLSDQSEVASAEFHKKRGISVTLHRDSRGKLFLYTLEAETAREQETAPKNLGQLDVAANRFEPLVITADLKGNRPTGIISASPNALLLETGNERLRAYTYYNLSQGQTRVDGLTSWGQQYNAADSQGRVIQGGVSHGYSYKVFILPGDRQLIVRGDVDQNLVASLDGTAHTLKIPDQFSWGRAGIDAFQTPDGKVYLAYGLSKSDGTNRRTIRVCFFEIGGADEPIYTASWNARDIDRLHWFTDSEGHPFLALGSLADNWTLKVIDPLLQREVLSFPLSAAIKGWHSNAENTYFWNLSQNGVRVFEMFGEVPR